MNKRKLLKTHLKSKVYDLHNLKSNETITLKNNCNLYFIDDKNSDLNQTITFNVLEHVKSNVYFYFVSSANKHQINLIFNHKNNSELHLFVKAFASGNSENNININVIAKKNLTNIVSDQQIKGYMFSKDSVINVIPALIIDTNSIKASHSVDVGFLDQNKLFFLQSRGLNLNQAIDLLIRNKLSPLTKINDKQYIYNILWNKLKKVIG